MQEPRRGDDEDFKILLARLVPVRRRDPPGRLVSCAALSLASTSAGNADGPVRRAFHGFPDESSARPRFEKTNERTNNRFASIIESWRGYDRLFVEESLR